MSRNKNKSAFSDNLVSRFNGRALLHTYLWEVKSPEVAINEGLTDDDLPTGSPVAGLPIAPTNPLFGARCLAEAELFSRFRVVRLSIKHFPFSTTTDGSFDNNNSTQYFSALCFADPAASFNNLDADDLIRMGGEVLYGNNSTGKPTNIKVSVNKSWLFTDLTTTNTEVSGLRQSQAGQILVLNLGLVSSTDSGVANTGCLVIDYEFEFKGRIFNTEVAPPQVGVVPRPLRVDPDERKEPFLVVQENLTKDVDSLSSASKIGPFRGRVRLKIKNDK